MHINRRQALGTLVAATLLSSRPSHAPAQGTPVAVSAAAPGYAIARVRALSTPELNAAIIPDVTATFLPRTAALPGYAGYVLSEHLADPTATITLTLLADEAATVPANDIAREYVGSLDPRFATETPFAEQGPVRVFQTTTRPAAELPPFLHGCQFTMRHRVTAPGVDVDALIAQLIAPDGLVAMLAAMPGFVVYCWIQTEAGRVAVNIWETLDQVATGNEAIAAWVAANTAEATIGEPVVEDGVVVYADIPEFI